MRNKYIVHITIFTSYCSIMGIQKQSTPSLSLVSANAHETLLNMDSLYSLPKYIAFWSKSNFTKFDPVYMEEYTNIYKIESLLLFFLFRKRRGHLCFISLKRYELVYILLRVRLHHSCMQFSAHPRWLASRPETRWRLLLPIV